MRTARYLVLGLLFIALAVRLAPARLDNERYGELREAERYQMDVAEKLYREGKYKDALGEYEKFITLYVESLGAPYAQYMIAACKYNLKKVNSAVKEYKAVLTYFPDAPEAPLSAYAIGNCYRNNGEPEEAVQQYLEVVKTWPEHPIAGDALWFASEIQIERGLNEKAIEIRRRLVETYPKSGYFNTAVDWLVEYYLYEQDNIPAARAICSLRREPLNTEQHLAERLYNHGYYLYNRYNKRTSGAQAMDKAVELYQGIMKQFADDAEAVKQARTMIAVCYRYSGRNAEARQGYEALLKDLPQDDGIRKGYASFLEESDQWDEARLQFLKLKDKEEGAWQMAQSYHRQRKISAAEEAYLRVVKDFPKRAQLALYTLGGMHHGITRNYEKAINAYRQSEYRPPEYLFRIGECFVAWEKYGEAIRTYTEIVGFFENHAPEAMWRIASCYEARGGEGDTESAIATLRKICDRFPKSRQASYAHQRLETHYKITYTGGGVAE